MKHLVFVLASNVFVFLAGFVAMDQNEPRAIRGVLMGIWTMLFAIYWLLSDYINKEEEQ